MDDVISLIEEQKTQDAYGVWRSERKAREVFCRVESVTRTEFYEGGRNGLNPEFRIRIFSGDYSGESILEFKGKTYSIYRTYQDGADTIELYVERKGGTNGKSQSDT